MAAICLWALPVLLSLLIQFTLGDVTLVHPDSKCSNTTDFNTTSTANECLSLDKALSALTDNDTLILSHGFYTLRVFSPNVTADLSNVSIIGNPSHPEKVIITCTDGVGLYFFNMSALSISGITIEQCGLSGEETISLAFERPKELIDFQYGPLLDFSAALLLIHTPDLQVMNVNIRNTSGFGLVGINLVGEVNFYRVQIQGNYPSQCILDKNKFSSTGGSGGGAFILYQDYLDTILDVQNHHELVVPSLKTNFDMTLGNISDNYACRLDPFNVLHNKISRSIQNPISSDLSLIGAGGLSFVMMQSSYQVNGSFTSCVFHNNSGTYNGEAMQIILHEAVNDSHVSVLNSIFHHNGEHLYKVHGTHGLGPAGAILIRYYVPNPSHDHEDDHHHADQTALFASQLPSGVTISDCLFQNNTAKNGGAVCVISFRPRVGIIQDRLEIRNSVFTYNQADFGCAIYLNDLSYNAFVSGLQVLFHSINATRNLNRDWSSSKSHQARSGIIDINFLTVAFAGTNYITNNLDTGVSLNGAILEISGTGLLERNVGSSGGALSLNAESYIVVKEAVNFTFLENAATIAGGGIFVNFETTRISSYDCFFFFHRIDFFCNFLKNCPPPIHAHFQFIDNVAPLGNAIFGTTFSDCPWAQILQENLDGSVASTVGFLNQLSLSFHPPLTLTSTNVVNTIADTIRPKSEKDREVMVMPGEEFVVILGAFDKLNQTVPVTVFTSIIPADQYVKINAKASIGATNRYLLDSETKYTTVPITVFGSQNTTYNLSIVSSDAPVEYTINVELKPCPLGYVYNATKQSCECEVSTYYNDVTCTGIGTIVFEGPWIGRVESQYARARCILDYCEQNVTEVSLDSPDVQCRNNRSGILCGSCKDGFSRVLGSSYSCVVCSNYYIFLILLFAVLGLILVVIITIFNITITTGYINGVIFYSNIMTIYLSTLSPSFDGVILQVPILLLNLQVGVETCFYHGMTDIHAAFLSFIFPVYLLVILVLITFFVKWVDNKYLVKFISKINITHVFATLILLSYTSIVRSCIYALDFIDISIENVRDQRWWIDPNQDYFEGLHIALFFISVFFLLVLLPLPVILLFPRIFLRYSSLKPLLDAFIAPLNQGSHSWVGFRILCRMVFLLLTLLDASFRFPILCIFIASITVLEAYIKPFKNTFQNLLDLSIMLNLTLMSVLAISSNFSTDKDRDLSITVSIFLGFFLVQVLCILLYHILAAIPWLRRFVESVVNRMRKKLASRMESEIELKTRMRVLSKHGTTRRVPVLEEFTHSSFEYPVAGERGDFQPAAFVGYRESIFESSSFPTERCTRKTMSTDIQDNDF